MQNALCDGPLGPLGPWPVGANWARAGPRGPLGPRPSWPLGARAQGALRAHRIDYFALIALNISHQIFRLKHFASNLSPYTFRIKSFVLKISH